MPHTGPGLKHRIRDWAHALGFQETGVASVELSGAEARLMEWIARGYHGEMKYFERHGTTRARPSELVPGTLRVISARMNYHPGDGVDAGELLDRPDRAYISRYALGRDYHKVLRDRLQKLCDRIGEEVGPFSYRVFTDSAPVMEVELAAQAALGWRGKHGLLLNREAGSWFFLGEIYTDLPLPPDAPIEEHCGTCERCIDVCPTRAIVAPYVVDARRCISYLTIEHPGSIPEPLRPMMGNRIYGCDDCQLACPWNKFAQPSLEPDFSIRHGLDDVGLAELFAWSEQTFLDRMRGSAIRRIGYERWLRNIAVALGNAPTTAEVVSALRARVNDPSALVREHVEWALGRHGAREA
ncbi:MAG: tRNA epoxyqueuosine(34) reductase QueG [Betaproteobacteria bacterium]|nr:tRNA epoxyqueuosine(34) reductase QueG [Betaproteobacteria bacterium]